MRTLIGLTSICGVPCYCTYQLLKWRVEHSKSKSTHPRCKTTRVILCVPQPLPCLVISSYEKTKMRCVSPRLLEDSTTECSYKSGRCPSPFLEGGYSTLKMVSQCWSNVVRTPKHTGCCLILGGELTFHNLIFDLSPLRLLKNPIPIMQPQLSCPITKRMHDVDCVIDDILVKWI